MAAAFTTYANPLAVLPPWRCEPVPADRQALRTDLQATPHGTTQHRPMPALLSSSSWLSPAFRDGMRRSLPLAFGVAAFGLVWGTLAGQAGLSAAVARP